MWRVRCTGRYSLVESAKLSGIEPAQYLTFATIRAIDELGSVLPHQMTAALA